ncbi:MAG: hypothetical protein JW818_15600, partial [Pirellulales bacterium]|nr:hypothetical protein [Pirellulales bacterium]
MVAALCASTASAIPIRIMAVGDSITAGYTDNSAWTVPFTFGGADTIAAGTSYELYMSDPIVATAETMNLMFHDAGDVAVLQVSWIDDVKITQVVPE